MHNWWPFQFSLVSAPHPYFFNAWFLPASKGVTFLNCQTKYTISFSFFIVRIIFHANFSMCYKARFPSCFSLSFNHAAICILELLPDSVRPEEKVGSLTGWYWDQGWHSSQVAPPPMQLPPCERVSGQTFAVFLAVYWGRKKMSDGRRSGAELSWKRGVGGVNCLLLLILKRPNNSLWLAVRWAWTNVTKSMPVKVKVNIGWFVFTKYWTVMINSLAK